MKSMITSNPVKRDFWSCWNTEWVLNTRIVKAFAYMTSQIYRKREIQIRSCYFHSVNRIQIQMNKGGTFLEKLWCCVGGG